MKDIQKNQVQQIPKVNIAGDYSSVGLDIAPNEPYISRESIRPNGGGGVQFEDEVPPSGRRDSKTPQVDFPVDE